MEKKVSFFEAWNRALSLEVERQYFNRYLGKNLTSLALDAQPPSSEALEAELEALARALTPERLCGVVRLAPEGLYLFEEAVSLRYQDAWGFWQENIHISQAFIICSYHMQYERNPKDTQPHSIPDAST